VGSVSYRFVFFSRTSERASSSCKPSFAASHSTPSYFLPSFPRSLNRPRPPLHLRSSYVLVLLLPPSLPSLSLLPLLSLFSLSLSPALSQAHLSLASLNPAVEYLTDVAFDKLEHSFQTVASLPLVPGEMKVPTEPELKGPFESASGGGKKEL